MSLFGKPPVFLTIAYQYWIITNNVVLVLLADMGYIRQVIYEKGYDSLILRGRKIWYQKYYFSPQVEDIARFSSFFQ